VKAMATRPKSDPLFGPLVRASRALIADDILHTTDQHKVRQLKLDPPVVDHHDIAELLQQFHARHPLLSFVLGISNRNQSLRFDGSHDNHLKELI